MSESHSLEVYDKDGWCRTYPLQKPIIRIGSDSGNDVVLENERGDGVALLHAQLIASSDNGAAYRLINLADTEIRLNPEGDESLLPRSVVNVADAFTFIMGQFTLVFHTGSGAAHTEGKYATSVRQNIGLRLAVERTHLVPEEWINGVVTVSNLGDLTGVQFELDLDGFDHDCFDLEPGPLLSSGAEKEVLFRLYHRNVKPSAGQHPVTIRAAAPRAYPGEAAAVTQAIEVLPFYRHQVSILAPGQTDTPPEEQNLLAAKPMVVSTSRPGQQSGAIPVADSTNVWSSSGTTAPGARQAVEMKARPPRPAPTDPPSDDAEETEDWFTTPVESSAPPQAIPTTQEPLAAVPFGDTQPQEAASAEAAELWEVSDESSATKPAAQKPLPPAASQNESDDETDWWETPDEADVSPAAVVATAAAAAAVGVVAAATKNDDDDAASSVESSVPSQAISTTQEPQTTVPDTQAQTASTESTELGGVSDESSPATEPATQQPLPPVAPQTESDEESDWWETPDEADVSPAAVVATAAVVGAVAVALQDDDDTDPRPRRNEEKGETPVANPLPPEPDLPPVPAALPPVDVLQPTPDTEMIQPTVEDVAQEWLVKADAESAKARQLADEVDQAIQQQAETNINIDTPPEDLAEVAAPIATAAVLPAVEREQPPVSETETLVSAQPPQPADTSAESVPGQKPVSLWNKFKQKLPFSSDSDDSVAAESPSESQIPPPIPVTMEELAVEDPLPQVQVDPEPDLETEAEPVLPVSSEVTPELPQAEEPPLEIEELQLPMDEPAVVTEAESEPPVLPEVPQAELPPPQIEETQLLVEDPAVVTEAEPEPPVFPEVEPEVPPPQIEEPQLPVEEPAQFESGPEADSLPEIKDTSAVETANKVDVNTVEDKAETKEAPAVEDDWWGEDSVTDEKPQGVLKLKANSADKLTTQSPKKETDPEDWWNEES